MSRDAPRKRRGCRTSRFRKPAARCEFCFSTAEPTKPLRPQASPRRGIFRQDYVIATSASQYAIPEISCPCEDTTKNYIPAARSNSKSLTVVVATPTAASRPTVRRQLIRCQAGAGTGIRAEPARRCRDSSSIEESVDEDRRADQYNRSSYQLLPSIQIDHRRVNRSLFSQVTM